MLDNEKVSVEQVREILLQENISSISDEERNSLVEKIKKDFPDKSLESIQDIAPVSENDKSLTGAQDSSKSYEEGLKSADQSNIGLGIDIVEINRIDAIIKKNPMFVHQVFSEEECEYCERMSNSSTHYALRFAAKEAVVKALGTGFAKGIWVQDIEVIRNNLGKPSIELYGKADEIAKKNNISNIVISLSNTKNLAVACAMAIPQSRVKKKEKKHDPLDEIAKQFKETRRILDEI